ncbi:unnamed protein product [Rotaria magnacalcarata]|nr:unnamed protein product [Rotaria magnacalcarata]CAF4238412.1 unnamed protein product [Rotaria magnacalcarata]
MTNGVQLEYLPPHSTTILQPLDVVTRTKVKTAWRKLLHQHKFKTNSAPIDKVKFAYLIKDLWQNNLLKSRCQGGFAKAGIYPFDPRAVSKEKLLSPPSSIGLHDNQVSLPILRSDSNGNMVHRNRSTNTSRTINRSSSCINLSTLSLDLTMTTLEFLTGSNSKNSHSIPQTNEALLHRMTTSSNSASTIIDTSTNSVNDITSHNSSTNTSNALNALTKAINNHMTSSQQITNNKRKKEKVPDGNINNQVIDTNSLHSNKVEWNINSTHVSSNSYTQAPTTVPFNISEYSNRLIHSYTNNNDVLNNMSYQLSCYRCDSFICPGSIDYASCSRVSCFQCISNNFTSNQTNFTCECYSLQGAITYTQL